VFPSTAVLNV
jgi:hypothetical protein